MNQPLTEQQVVSILRVLWRFRATTISDLARHTRLHPQQVKQAVHSLRERRCLIEETPHGIELIRTDISCWQDVLEAGQATKGAILAREVRVFRTTDSTNDICWEAANEEGCQGLLVLADEQLSGRGRRGSLWSANPGQSILMSILLRSFPGAAESLTLLLGLACAEALEAFLGHEVEIKWPNDVLVRGKKIAGVLVERREASAAESSAIVLGVGINVSQAAADFPPPLRERATSVYLASGRQIDRLELIERLLERMEERCLRNAESGNTQAWLSAWKSRCHLLGQNVEIQASGPQNRVVRGRIMDVDPLEGLVVRDEIGTTHFFPAQRASIVK